MADGPVYEVCFGEGTNNEIVEARLTKWKVRAGSRVSQGTVLLLYDMLNKNQAKEEAGTVRKVKATSVGTIKVLLKQEGDTIEQGCGLLMMQGCSHPIVMKDMCAECGADLLQIQKEKKQSTASVSMVHSVPELMVSQEQAEILGRADEERLIKNRKLVLLVDLDETLIHTTNDDIPPNLKDVHHFQMHGTKSPWYHVRIRPGTNNFLEKISNLYELHICTFGARLYAHIIAKFLDGDGRLFSHRILSREECFNANSKIANMKLETTIELIESPLSNVSFSITYTLSFPFRALFPCGDQLVCIIDDREDVWNFAPNLVHVKPYHFFQHTGDINAPPGLSKTENDSECSYVVGTRKMKIKRKKKYASKIEDSCPVSSSETVETAEAEMETLDEPRAVSAVETDSVVQQSEVSVVSSDLLDANSDVVPKSSEMEEEPVVVEPTKEVKVDETITPTIVDTPPSNGTDILEKLEDDSVEVEDEDDYLLYLSDILTKIHKAFYKMYDHMQRETVPGVPSLRTIVPLVRRSVLRGVNIVFSGVIPTNAPIEKSRAFHVAKCLGAEIQLRLVPKGNDSSSGRSRATTHVVAARLGTVKVNEAKKMPGVHIVTPDWLWCCADRWDRVDEAIFPLTKTTVMIDRKGSKGELPDKPDSMAEKENVMESAATRQSQTCDAFPTYDPVTGKRINKAHKENGCDVNAADVLPRPDYEKFNVPSTSSESGDSPSDRFSESINPLMIFSNEDIANMDREVEDFLDLSDSNSSEGEIDDVTKRLVLKKQTGEDCGISSSSCESLSSERPKGWGKRRAEDKDDRESTAKHRRCEIEQNSDNEPTESNDDDEGESIGSVDEEMAAEVERQFLGL